METKQYAAAGPWIGLDDKVPELDGKAVLAKYADGSVALIVDGQVYRPKPKNYHKMTHWAEVRV